MNQVTRSRKTWWLAGLVTMLAIHGCGGPVRYIRSVNDGPDRYVRLESRYGHGQGYGYDGAAMRFTHPLVLGEPDWGKILKGIRVQLRKRLLTIGATEAHPEEAFSESEAQYLARYLAEAFSIARPDEWVVFCLSRQRGEGGTLRGGPGVTEMTTGGFFVEGGKFHFVLANYRYAVSIPSVQEQIRDDPLRPAGDAFYDLVPGPHQTARWLDTINTQPDLTKPLRAQLSEMVIEYQPFLALPDEATLAPGGRPPLEERLRTLQRLRDQGLITEEEYRLKRQNLLDEL
ncbi:MAG: SHOCT domain-containing protein [Elusimicrobia bacterium]|nr:SHOCT domain-containing protein [Elusimicrobiota bacterium]